jgi:alkylation response protein AidB-like acyl-CoA dehydrogenase
MCATWTEEQEELRRTVRRLLDRQAGSGASRAAADTPLAYDARLWSRLAGEVGVAALAVPEEYGGVGGSVLESLLVLEELGRDLTPSPMLGSAVLATQALLLAGDSAMQAELLAPLAAGERTAALAWVGPSVTWRPDGSGVDACPTSAGECSLTGRAYHVVDGDSADDLVVAARTGAGLGLFAVRGDDDGVEREALPGMDQTRRLSTVTFDHARGRLLGADGDGVPVLARVRDLALVALAMEQVGAAARCLETTVAYTREREQFGRPIGSFQALKHRMADLHVLVETARSAAYAAAWAAVGTADGQDDLRHWAALAKVHCSEALFAVAAESVQMHGGIALTWEHDAQRYLKRAHGSAQLFGAPRLHVARIGETLLR